MSRLCSEELTRLLNFGLVNTESHKLSLSKHWICPSYFTEHFGKEENAGYQHFLLFTQYFQKAFPQMHQGLTFRWNVRRMKMFPYPITTQCRNLKRDQFIAVENIVRKGGIACNKHFLLFSQYFLLYMIHIFHFKCTLKCCLQFVSIWTSLNFLLSGNGLWKVWGFITDNWIREAKRWCPALKVLIYYGSQEDRRATRQYVLYNKPNDFHVIITT